MGLGDLFSLVKEKFSIGWRMIKCSLKEFSIRESLSLGVLCFGAVFAAAKMIVKAIFGLHDNTKNDDTENTKTKTKSERFEEFAKKHPKEAEKVPPTFAALGYPNMVTTDVDRHAMNHTSFLTDEDKKALKKEKKKLKKEDAKLKKTTDMLLKRAKPTQFLKWGTSPATTTTTTFDEVGLCPGLIASLLGQD